MEELGAMTTKYIKDHPPTDIRDAFLPYLVRVRAMSLPPEEAVPFMKEALQQYLKGHGKDANYFGLLSVVGDAFINLGMKHQSSKIFRKIKLKQTNQIYTESMVSPRSPIRNRFRANFSFFSISRLLHASTLATKRESESSHCSKPRQQSREIVSSKSSSTCQIDQQSLNENIMRRNMNEISPISVLR